jgi:transposase
MSGKKGMKCYAREVKLEAVRLYLEERQSQAQVVEALGISNARQVKRWVHQYRQEGEATFE